MLLSVPDLASLLAQSGADALNFEHTYFFDVELLVWMLRDAGYTVAEPERFERHSFFVDARPTRTERGGPPARRRDGAGRSRASSRPRAPTPRS